MAEHQTHVLLHPVRMRVFLVLGTGELTTKQIHERLPDVAQASLYRAIARLEDAGMVTVVERNKRGGALESVYGIAPTWSGSASGKTAEEFAAAAGMLAHSLSLDAATHAAAGEWRPDSAGLLRENVHLTPEQFEMLRGEVVEFVRRLAATEPQADTREYSVTIAGIPRPSQAG